MKAELASVVAEKEQLLLKEQAKKNLLLKTREQELEQKILPEASLQEATAAKEEIYQTLEQERSAEPQTGQELAAEQERAAKMAANNLRLEREKNEL